LRHVATLEPPAELNCLGSVSIGPAGQAVAVWTDPAGLKALSFVETDDDDRAGPMAGPAAATAITVHCPAKVQTVEIPGVRGVRPIAQPLPDERVLLVGWGAEWRPSGPDENATIYGPDGRTELSACVGDAASQVRATRGGSVWVGYDDMGIFGNNGWGGPGEPHPLGAPGLIRFTPDLTIEWEFPGDLPPGRVPALSEPIDDCEAIALAEDGDTAWMYYYSSFPVVRIARNDSIRAWSPRAREAVLPVNVQALASDGQHVALAGAQGGAYHGDRVVVARLEDDWTPVRRPRLVLPDRARLPTGATMAGFGDTLHVFAGRDWYQVAVAELL
jgi:hypothetical protein